MWNVKWITLSGSTQQDDLSQHIAGCCGGGTQLTMQSQEQDVYN